jgi:hypothetical protein
MTRIAITSLAWLDANHSDIITTSGSLWQHLFLSALCRGGMFRWRHPSTLCPGTSRVVSRLPLALHCSHAAATVEHVEASFFHTRHAVNKHPFQNLASFPVPPRNCVVLTLQTLKASTGKHCCNFVCPPERSGNRNHVNEPTASSTYTTTGTPVVKKYDKVPSPRRNSLGHPGTECAGVNLR